MTLFGLESADVAFLGLLFGILSGILGPLTYFLINMSKKMAILVEYVKRHEEESNKEGDKLEKVVVKLAVIDIRIKTLERMFVDGKRIGAMDLGEDINGD